MANPLPPVGSLQGIQLLTLSAGTAAESKPDRPSAIYEIRIWSSATLAAATLSIVAEGLGLASGSAVPLPMWTARAAVDVQSGVLGYLYIIRPERPWLWSPEMPLRLTCSAGASALVIGEPLSSGAAR